MFLANMKLRRLLLCVIFVSFTFPMALVVYGVATDRFSAIAGIASLLFALSMLGAILFFIVYGLYDLVNAFSKRVKPKQD